MNTILNKFIKNKKQRTERQKNWSKFNNNNSNSNRNVVQQLITCFVWH
jgi:hypothetical protein